MPTKISWTQTQHADGTITQGETWNPLSGCSHASEGCRFCYAERMALQFGWSQKPWTAANAKENVVLHPERLRKPYSWKKPTRCFVNSMADCYHEDVPDAFIAEMFKVMNDLQQHTFIILTKRADRLARWAGPWTPNIWAGVSVENRRALERIDWLRLCGAQIKLLSCEPLLEDLGQMNLEGVQWVICGGESGPHIPGRPDRQMNHAWARSIKEQCVAQNIAFWFKQSSGPRSEMGTELIERDGSRTVWRQFPETAQSDPEAAPEQLSLFG